MKWLRKRTDITSLWEEDGDLERMKAYFSTIEADSAGNERIKQSVKQKVIEKMAKEEVVGGSPMKVKEGFSQQILTKLRVVSGFRRWKLSISVAGLAILMIIGRGVLNGSWNFPPRMGSTVQEKNMSQSRDMVTQTVGSIGAGEGVQTKGDASDDGSAAKEVKSQKTTSSMSMADSSSLRSEAKESLPSPLPPGQAVVPPADAGIPRKITLDLDLTLEVTTINDTVAKISQEVRQLGGYIADSQQNGLDSHSSAHMTVKIPADKLNGLRDSLANWGKVLDQHLVANDITNQYYDSQARLQTLEAEEKRYLEILNQAKTVDDVLKVENALGNIRQQIEQLKGQLKLWNNQVDYSTVNVTLQSPNVSVKNPWQPISWSKTWKATQDAVLKTISSTWNLLNYLLVGIGYLLPYLIIVAMGWGVYRVWKKRKS